MSIREIALKRARNVIKIKNRERGQNKNGHKCMCFIGLLKDCMPGVTWNRHGQANIDGKLINLYHVAGAYNISANALCHGIALNDDTDRSLVSICEEVFSTQ